MPIGINTERPGRGGGMEKASYWYLKEKKTTHSLCFCLVAKVMLPHCEPNSKAQKSTKKKVSYRPEAR
jgi:uncharacterized lipoprotein YajG